MRRMATSSEQCVLCAQRVQLPLRHCDARVAAEQADVTILTAPALLDKLQVILALGPAVAQVTDIRNPACTGLQHAQRRTASIAELASTTQQANNGTAHLHHSML